VANVNRRLDVTTIAEQIKIEEVNIMKDNVLLATAEDKGRVSTGHSGKKMEWNVKVRRNRFNPYGDGDPQNFDRQDRRIECSAPWRMYRQAESVSEFEKEINKGEAARVQFVSQVAKDLMDDVRFYFAPELLLDGNATANAGRIDGINTFSGYTGSGAWLSPSDTYAGHSTEHGSAAGGAQISGSYPTGVHDIEFDSYSPLFVNADHASWLTEAGGSGNEAKAWLYALRAGLIHNVNTRGAAQGKVDVLLTYAERYRKFLAVLDDKERIVVERNAATSRLIKLGFGNVTNFDGTDITYESNVEVGRSYGWKYDQMEIRSLKSQMFWPSDDFDLERLADRYSVVFMGNCRWNPRGFLFVNEITLL
jgi:hypothetical protein